MLPSAPVMGEGMVSMTSSQEIGNAVGDFVDGELMRLRVADDAAFAHVSAAGFELRLDENDGFGERGRGRKDRREQQRCGDERNIHDQEREARAAPGSAECIRGKKPGIGAFHEANARVVAQLHGDLAEAGIDGGNLGCAVLQQAVGKAAGGGAYVEAGAAFDVDLPVVESAPGV